MPDEKPKFRGKKDAPKNVDESQIQEFAKKANEQDKPEYPWNDPSVRSDRKQMVPLYIPEDAKIKLKYLSDQTGIPQQRILRDMLVPLIEEKIKDIIEEQESRL